LKLLVTAAFAVLACHCGSSGGTPPPDSGPPSSYVLAITNYMSWCTITEQGVAFSASMSFAPGTVVALNAIPASSAYKFGYWTNTSDNTAESTTVTMNGSASVVACCPLVPPAAQTCTGYMPPPGY
jgi:hypothetical protein